MKSIIMDSLSIFYQLRFFQEFEGIKREGLKEVEIFCHGAR